MHVPPVSTVFAYTAYQRQPKRFQRPLTLHHDTASPRPAMRRHTDVDILA